jgi:hypothetical protein
MQSGIEGRLGEHVVQQLHGVPLAQDADMLVDGHAQQGDSEGGLIVRAGVSGEPAA